MKKNKWVDSIALFTFISFVPIIGTTDNNYLFIATLVTAIIVSLTEIIFILRRNKVDKYTKAIYGIGLCIFAISNICLSFFFNSMSNIFYVTWIFITISIYAFIFCPLTFKRKELSTKIMDRLH